MLPTLCGLMVLLLSQTVSLAPVAAEPWSQEADQAQTDAITSASPPRDRETDDQGGCDCGTQPASRMNPTFLALFMLPLFRRSRPRS